MNDSAGYTIVTIELVETKRLAANLTRNSILLWREEILRAAVVASVVDTREPQNEGPHLQERARRTIRDVATRFGWPVKSAWSMGCKRCSVKELAMSWIDKIKFRLRFGKLHLPSFH